MCRDGMANGHYGMPRALLVVPKRFPFCLKYHTRGYDLNEGGLVYRYLASCYVSGALDPKAPRRYHPICCRFLFSISPYRAIAAYRSCYRALIFSRFRLAVAPIASSCSADRLRKRAARTRTCHHESILPLLIALLADWFTPGPRASKSNDEAQYGRRHPLWHILCQNS